MKGGLGDVVRTTDWLPEAMNKFYSIFQGQNGIMGFCTLNIQLRIMVTDKIPTNS